MLTTLHRLRNHWRPTRPRALTVTLDAYLRVQPIFAGGWLDPKGNFIGVNNSTHAVVAFHLLEPDWQQRGLTFQPDARNYELEMEQRRYVKLMKNDYWFGWCNPRFRPTRPQTEVMVDWYLDRERKLPDWLQQHFEG